MWDLNFRSWRLFTCSGTVELKGECKYPSTRTNETDEAGIERGVFLGYLQQVPRYFRMSSYPDRERSLTDQQQLVAW